MSTTPAPTSRDVYDDEIDRLSVLTPEEIYEEWNAPSSPLFDFLTESREDFSPGNRLCGCPTQVVYQTADDPFDLRPQLLSLQLPNTTLCDSRIHPDELQAFARAQRLADTLIPNRKPPTSRPK